jgi:hypothetical protein
MHALTLIFPHTHTHIHHTHTTHTHHTHARAVVLKGLCEADASGEAAEAYAVFCRDLSGNSFSGDVKPLANMTGLAILYYTRYV